MRIWFSGPRMLNGLVRPGVSFGPEDFRKINKTTEAFKPKLIDMILLRMILAGAALLVGLACLAVVALIWALIVT